MTSQTGQLNNLALTAEDTGPVLVALAGLGAVGYGILFLIVNFTSLIELGLSAEDVGVTAEEIQAFSLDLYHYISHVQTALGGFVIGFGLAIAALAWFGIRRGYWWAFWTAVVAPVGALIIALPLHYSWGFADFSHLALVYLDILILLVGAVLSYRKLKSGMTNN